METTAESQESRSKNTIGTMVEASLNYIAEANEKPV